jgi:GNAT superfamily N-acetyltransferase
MAHRFIELSPQAPPPPLGRKSAVVPIPDEDRRRHRPDVSLLLADGGELLARCSCWLSGTALYEGSTTGAIGHYAAVDEQAGALLLERAIEWFADAGASTAVGPMDGNTWRRHRFIVERGPEPVFFLEPDNPDEWPAHWTATGFEPLATYTSAINDDLGRQDPRTSGTRDRFAGEGILIRMIDTSRVDMELRRIYELSLAAFHRNFLYTPIAEPEFLAQYHAVLPVVRPELVLMAERREELLGFMFAVPDVLQARRGSVVDTVILKTMAVHPTVAGAGLGSALMDLVQRAAQQLGFRRAIHALIHESNASRHISGRYARTIRRYALYSRRIAR